MTVLRPRTAREALGQFSRRPEAIPLAGGTDFMVSWNAGHLNGRTVLDLWAVREWARIEVLPGGLRIGALVTHADIKGHPVVRRHFPALAAACATVGAEQIQNRGTLGGNIANASPAADTFPPLAVHDAVVHAATARGRRSVPFQAIFAGVKKTTLGPAELIESVEIPFPHRPPDRQGFRKVGARAAQTISKTMGAFLLWLAPGGKAGRSRRGPPVVEELRAAFGSVAPTVRRLKAAESRVAGQALTPELIEEAAALVREDISPIDDLRSTADYRRGVAENLLRDFLAGAL